MTQKKVNLSLNTGTRGQDLYLQLRVLSISLPSYKSLTFKVAVCLGARTLDTTKEEYTWQLNEECLLKRCVVNFHANEHTDHKHHHMLAIIKSEDLQQIAAVDLNIKDKITKFLFQGDTKFQCNETFLNKCKIRFVIWVQKSRVLLLNQILKKGDVSQEEAHIPQIGNTQTQKIDKSDEKSAGNQAKVSSLARLIEDNKNVVAKASTRPSRFNLLPPLITKKPPTSPRMDDETAPTNPSKTEQPEWAQEIESPLMKIIKGKLQTRSLHDNFKRNQSIKNVASQRFTIKRADSIDEDEEIEKKSFCKKFFISLIVFIIGCLIVSWRKTSNKPIPNKPSKPTKKTNKAKARK